jgi:hypothetical protein
VVVLVVTVAETARAESIPLLPEVEASDMPRHKLLIARDLRFDPGLASSGRVQVSFV